MNRRRHLWPIALAILFGLAACIITPTREIDLESDDVLFHDEFVVGNSGNWMLEADAVASTAIFDEQLVIQVDAPNMMQFATLSDPLFDDFVLLVEARQMAGDLQSSYGILLRMQDNTRFYRFDITGDGMYIVERRNPDGSWTRFVEDWVDSAAINKGLSVANHLRLEADGTTMRFFVNDTLLHQVSDSQYAAGTIALDAGTFGQPGLQVMFDNLVILRP